jgi:hypothetical protein
MFAAAKREDWAKVLLGATIALFLASQFAYWEAPVRRNGDEPHILMTAISLLEDGDFNVLPNYERRDYVRLGFSDLKPQVSPTNGYVPPEHGLGFPILIAPFFWATGISGTRITLILLCGLSLLLTFGTCRRIGLDSLSSAAVTLALVSTTPWMVHAGLIIPEMLAGTMVLVIAFLFLGYQSSPTRWRAFGIGLTTVLLPIVYLKYASIAVASGALLIADRRLARDWAAYLPCMVIVPYALLWFAVYGPSISIGTGGGPADFTFEGMSSRFWYAFLDARYGLLPWAPVALAAFSGFVFIGLRDTWATRLYLSTCVILYALMYAAFAGSGPGTSAPGRYLTAVIPALTLLGGLGCLGGGTRGLPQATFALFLTLNILVLLTSLGGEGRAYWQAILDLFPRIYENKDFDFLGVPIAWLTPFALGLVASLNLAALLAAGRSKPKVHAITGPFPDGRGDAPV